MKILYVAGATRSGSTLFHDILAQVEGFEGVGELRDIWQYGMLDNRLCGCGLPFHSCDYWSGTLADAFGEAPVVDARRWAALTERFRTRDLLCATPSRRRTLLADLGPLVDVLTTLYTTIDRRMKSRVIIDSSKNPAFGYLLGSIPELDVRYVHLVRDAPAVAYSLGKRKESEPGRRLPRKRPWQSSLDWTMRNIAAERHLRRRPMMRLRYEDLVSDPRDIVTAVCELLDEDPGDLSFLSGAKVAMRVRPHSVFGNPGRFRDGDTTLRADAEWQTRMNSTDAFIVKAVTLPLRLRYGYAGASARRG